MRLVAGLVVLAVVVAATLVAGGSDAVVLAQRAAAPRGEPAALVTLTSQIGDKQQLTLIDPQTHAMAVYHVDSASGEITLKSVRNIHWDLQMLEFNGKSPSPREIRAMIEQK